MTNFVIIDGGTGIETKTIYNNLIDFPVPSMTKWTSYVVVLREDFGWTNEKNQPLSFNDMWDVLGNVKKISIRGDNWLHDVTARAHRPPGFRRIMPDRHYVILKSGISCNNHDNRHPNRNNK